MQQPPVSLVLATWNALPHLRQAIEAMRSQTHRNLHLIVQDGGSTDGTLEYLRGLDGFAGIDIDSRPDRGIAQAYARGLARVRTDLIMMVSSDERLEPEAVSTLVAAHAERPGLVVAYGAMRIVSENGDVLQTFVPKPFDFDEIMACVTVPPISTCMFSRAVIGDQFFYDETLVTCPDYDFWLRLGSRFAAERFQRLETTLAEAIGDRTSMSYRPEAHVQMAKDKTAALVRFLAGEPLPDAERERRTGIFTRGIYCWAAEMVHNLEGASALYQSLCVTAARAGGVDGRLAALLARIPELATWAARPQDPPPAWRSQAVDLSRLRLLQDLSLDRSYVFSGWRSAVTEGLPVDITGGPDAWSYAWQLPVPAGPGEPRLWVEADAEVTGGRAGIGLMQGDDLVDERVLGVGARAPVYLRIRDPRQGATLVVRNAEAPFAHVQIHGARLVADG